MSMSTTMNRINDPPMQPKLFPKPIVHRGVRNATIHVKSTVDDDTIQAERIWLIRSDTTSSRAYRKVPSKPTIRSPSDTSLLVTCVVLTRIPNTTTYQEPPRPHPSFYDDDNDQSVSVATGSRSEATGTSGSHVDNDFNDQDGDIYKHLVIVKKYMKRSNAASVAKSSYDYIKDAYVLQTCGSNDSSNKQQQQHPGIGGSESGLCGILKPLEVLEDERYVYIVTQYSIHGTLEGSPYLGTPSSVLHTGSDRFGVHRREQRVKYMLRHLLRILQRLHNQHLICHSNLCPQTIIYNGDDISSPLVLEHQAPVSSGSSHASSTSSSRLILDDFALSLMYPTSSTAQSTTKRHWIKPQDIISPIDKQYLSPEIYSRKKFDGPLSTDVWSCGVILFNLLTGCKLYNFPSQLDPIYHHVIANGGLTNKNNINETTLNSLLNKQSSTTHQNQESGNSNNGRPQPPPSSSLTQHLIDIILSLNSLSSDAKSLMNDMLQIDPTKRISVDNALNHPWLLK